MIARLTRNARLAHAWIWTAITTAPAQTQNLSPRTMRASANAQLAIRSKRRAPRDLALNVVIILGNPQGDRLYRLVLNVQLYNFLGSGPEIAEPKDSEAYNDVYLL